MSVQSFLPDTVSFRPRLAIRAAAFLFEVQLGAGPLLLIVLLFGICAQAQSSPTQSQDSLPQQPAQPRQTSDQQQEEMSAPAAVLRVTTRLVVVDVVAADKRGHASPTSTRRTSRYWKMANRSRYGYSASSTRRSREPASLTRPSACLPTCLPTSPPTMPVRR